MGIPRKLAFRAPIKVILYGLLFWTVPAICAIVTPPGPPRQIGTCDPSATTQKVSFVHVGDLHARYGASFAHKWAKLYRYYQDVLVENPYTVFTNAGDDYEKGSVAEQTSAHGTASREAVFATGFDVRVLGNHDYAWGEEELLPFSHDPKAIVLASNTVYSGTGSFGAVDYGELQVGCVKVGFFGMVSKPWNEFDQQYVGDFLPNFANRWDWNARAREIIAAKRSSVDLLVMVSHLGFGTDKSVAKYTPHPNNSSISGIDLILGGHNHGGFQFAVVKNAPVVQPEFYGDGLSRFDITWDIRNRRILSRSSAPLNVYTSSLTATNSVLQGTLQAIVDRYAPDSDRQRGVLEVGRNYVELAEIAGKAGISVFGADAALIDPALTWVSGFSAGAVTQQMFNNLYRVERQPSNTPGFNSLYMATVSGAGLSAMDQAQPGWVYVGPAAPVSGTSYKVLLHKAPALHPTNYFPSSAVLSNVAPKAETWSAMDQYAVSRTANCLYLDTDTALPSCGPDNTTTVWNFDDPAQPFKTDRGVATMTYRGSTPTTFLPTNALGLPNLPDGASGVMAFPKTMSTQGYSVTHNFPANGAFKANGLVSNYTLVMDVLWPSSSNGLWRALLQTNPNNSDDADWFVSTSNAIGISGSYFGSLQPGLWYRIALVASTASSGGSLQVYINGTQVGTIGSATSRWALNPQLLLFTDDGSETAAGYANAIMLSNRAWTADEIATLGGPSAIMSLSSTETLRVQNRLQAEKKQVIVRRPPATRKYRGLEQRKGEFDNKADKLRSQ